LRLLVRVVIAVLTASSLCVLVRVCVCVCVHLRALAQCVFKLILRHAQESLNAKDWGTLEQLERYCKSLQHNFRQDERVRAETAALAAATAHETPRIAHEVVAEQQRRDGLGAASAASVLSQPFSKTDDATIRQRQKGVKI